MGFSETSRFYAIKDASEAESYLQHPVLGARLIEICEALLGLNSNNATQVFGSPDDVKLKSSMTLFSALDQSNPIFEKVLSKFFGGAIDQKTLQILNQQS